MSIATIIISLFAFILFTTPIFADFNKLKKHISLHDNVIYTGAKTIIYLGYPFFISVNGFVVYEILSEWS